MGALHEAVKQDDPVAIKQLVDAGEDLFLSDASGFTAPELAALLGRRSCWDILGLEFSPQAFPNDDVDFLPCLTFESYDSLRALQAQCPYLLRWTKVGQFYKDLAIDYGPAVFQGKTAPLQISWVSDNVGHGVFATEDIPPGSFIGNYAGVVRPMQRKIARMSPYYFHYPTKLWSYQYHVVDAEGCGNEMRYLNHSDQPNLEPSYILDRGLLHLVFFTQRFVMKGEQLTFDYGQDYWREREKVAL
jgi:hypothetical protein